MFFDDLAVGFTFETPAHLFTQDDIIAYAQVYDPQPFHIDPEAAARSIYGGIIASGFHTMLVAFNLWLKAGIWNEASMGSPGMREVQWRRPVRPGDRLRIRAEVVGSSPSRSRADRGRIEVRTDVLNQADELVMSYTATHILKRKPAA